MYLNALFSAIFYSEAEGISLFRSFQVSACTQIIRRDDTEGGRLPLVGEGLEKLITNLAAIIGPSIGDPP